MRTLLLSAFVVVGLALNPAGAARAADGKPFQVPGVFSIDSPEEGFEWKEVKVPEIQALNGGIYLCTKEGATGKAVLTMERRAADEEKKKVAALKGHFNGLVQSLQKGGYTNLRGKQPSFAAPIPGRVTYPISATTPDGQPVYIGAATVFGKNIYSFQAFAGSDAEAARLLKVVESLKEGD